MTTEHATPAAADGGIDSIALPCSLGRDQEAREGLQRELWVADIDSTTEPLRVAIDYTNTADDTTPQELGWFDLRTAVRQLAEFAPDLVVIRREDLPEVTITQHATEPTTCTVDIGGVRRFSGADWSHHSTDAMHLRSQLTEARMKLATAESTIEHQRGRIQTLTDACQRKNGDVERYANERATAIEAQRAAEEETADMRARWAAYATALARLENTTTPQVIGKNVVMRHETYTKLESQRDQLAESWVTSDEHENVVTRMTTETQGLRRSNADVTAERNATLDQLDQERKDHEETRNELRAMTAHARKWQRFAAVIELMEDANYAELIIDGVRITPADGVRTKATKE